MNDTQASVSWTIGQDEIDRRVTHMGKELAARWPEGKAIDMVVVLDSGLFFANDLIRAIQAASSDVVINLHTVKCSVCPRGKQGELQLTGLPTYLGDHDLHILLVDALMNTGKVQNYVAKHVIGAFDPTLFETCVLLLSDRVRSEWPSEICYFGFKVPDVPMVGYGLGPYWSAEQGVRSLNQPHDDIVFDRPDLSKMPDPPKPLPGEPVTDVITMPDDAEMPKGLPALDAATDLVDGKLDPGFDETCQQPEASPSEPEAGPEEPGAEPAEPGPEPTEANEEGDGARPDDAG